VFFWSTHSHRPRQEGAVVEICGLMLNIYEVMYTRDRPAIEPTTHTRAAAPAASHSHRPSTSRELRDGTSGVARWGTLRGEAFHCTTTGPLHEHASSGGESDTPPTDLHPLWGRGHILLWVRKAWRHQRMACSTHRVVAVCAAPEPRAAVVDER